MTIETSNLDSMFPEWQSDTDRVFPCDAFISHKWQDSASDELLGDLRSLGLEVWHDGHQNLADQRVLQKVSQALAHSRTVVVCCSRSFDNSPWCRAEYLSAFSSGCRARSHRVVLAIMCPGLTLPEELRFEVPHFHLYLDGQLKELARYLHQANKLPYDPKLIAAETALLNSETYLREIRRLDKEDQSRTSTVGSIWRSLIEGTITAEDIARIDAEAPYRALNSDCEYRALAIGQLCDIDRFHPCANRRRTILRLLAKESSEVVVGEALQWMVLRHGSLSNKELQLLYRSVMPASMKIKMNYSTLQNVLPAGIRALVQAGPVEKTLLSPRERMLLCLNRVDFILDGTTDEKDGFDEIQLPAVLHINQIEVVLREMKLIFLKQDEKVDLGGEGESIRADYLSGVERIVRRSDTNGGPPLSEVNKFVYDEVLVPVMACLEGTTQERARNVFTSVCDFMEIYGGKYAPEHASYRRALGKQQASPRWPPRVDLFEP